MWFRAIREACPKESAHLPFHGRNIEAAEGSRMTDALTKERLCELATEAGGPCVSLFLPTHAAPCSAQQDAVRLERLLHRTRRQLDASVPDAFELDAQLAALSPLLHDRKFWKQQSVGLAVFVGAQRCSWYRVPILLQESATVASRFRLRPLLPLLGESARFFILGLNRSGVRLFECTKDTATEFQIAGFLPERSGRGYYPDFFRRIASRVSAFAGGSDAPILLAGEEPLLSAFRIVAGRLNLLEESLEAPFDLATAELHQRGLAILQARAAAIQSAAVERFTQRLARGGASQHIEEILPAAFLGSVEALFLASGAHLSGKYDICDWSVHPHTIPHPDDQDLIDLAAVTTYLHNGSVFVLDPEEMPNRLDIAAVFR